MKSSLLQIIYILILTLFFLSTGCAKTHRININPSLPIHNSNIGNGLPVSIKVIDNRSSNIVSKWQDGLKMGKFTIISQGDLKEIFTTKVQHGLSKLGFSPKKSIFKTKRTLKVEITNIRSLYQLSIQKMNIRVKTDLKAICQNQNKRISKGFTSKKMRSDITPATFPNEKLLNACLSEVLGKIFTDAEILACLAR